MRFIGRLDKRDRQPEIMDQPHLDSGRHRRALQGLARINRVSGSAGIFWPHLAAAASQGPIRVLDVASGGGDVALSLWRMAKAKKIPLHIDGCDISDTAIDFASERSRLAGASVQFFRRDILSDPIPEGYDAIVCSLFLHHLSEYDAVELLRRAGEAARYGVFVNDLVRCRTGLFLAHFASRVLTQSDVVRIDGPLSVRAAFTKAEAADLARRANLSGAVVTTCWPCRFLLQWRRPHNPSPGVNS